MSLVRTMLLNQREAATLLSTVESPVASPFVGMKCGLYSNEIVPDKDTVLADLTPLTYTGSAEKDVTLTPAVNESDGTVTTYSGVLQFRCTAAPAEPQYARGLYLTDGATPAKLLAVAPLPQLVEIAVVGDGFSAVVHFNHGAGASGDGRTVLN